MTFDQLATAVLKKDGASRSLNFARPVWVYGTGSFGKAVATALRLRDVTVLGFLETTPQATHCLGLPVMPITHAAKMGAHDQIAVGIFNRLTAYSEIEKLAKDAGAKDIFWPFDYYHQIADEMGWRFWLGSVPQTQLCLNEMAKAYDLLSDEKSKVEFERTVRFRMGDDLAYSSYMDDEPQYFCSLTMPRLSGRSLCYVDCGAFNGDSYIELQEKTAVTDAYLFEPDVANYADLIKNTASLEGNVKCFPLAVSDSHQILSFSGEGESGTVVEDGTIRITAAKLDGMLPNLKVDLLKLDIEGSEIAALKGARNIISKSRPIICVSLYHKPQDLWDIPLFISSIVNDYKYYIRQHMFNSFESVLYAVPEL